MGIEDIRTLLRAYAALTLAHHAAERYAAGTTPHPHLTAAVNSHELALRELERLLEGALAEVSDFSELDVPEEEYATLLM